MQLTNAAKLPQYCGFASTFHTFMYHDLQHKAFGIVLSDTNAGDAASACLGICLPV